MGKFAVFRVFFTALSAAGSISVPGLKVGDTMIWCLETPPAGTGSVGWVDPQSAFEAIISVNDQLQQLNSFGEGVTTLNAIFLRGI